MSNLYKKVKNSKGGFTLIELIVVVAILAIIAIILIPTVGGQIQKARHSAAVSDAQAVYSAAQLYATQYEVEHAKALEAKTYIGNDLDQFIKSPAFASLYKDGKDGKEGVNGLVVQSIVIGEGGSVKSVTIHDNNLDINDSLTYPDDAETGTSSTGTEPEQ